MSDAEESEEDEAVTYVGNLGSSIAQAGWMPGRGGGTRTGVWAASDMEMFSLWSDEARKDNCRPPPSLFRKLFL